MPNHSLRAQLIASLRGHEDELDRSYRTVRYGYVPSFSGHVIVGDELLTGHPSRGSAEFLVAAGHISRRPLNGVSTQELQKLSASVGRDR